MRWLVLLFALGGCDFLEEDDDDLYEPNCAGVPDVHIRRDEHELGFLSLAVGGTADLELECWANGYASPFDVAAAVIPDDDSVSAQIAGDRLVVTGAHDGATTVRIVNGGTTLGSIEVSVQAVDHVGFRSPHDKIPPTVDVAFAKEYGTQVYVILEAASGDELADDRMDVIPPPAAELTKWPQRPPTLDYKAVAFGDYTLEATSGGMTYAVPFAVVDHADSISLVDPGVTIHPVFGTDVCFAAQLDSRFVTELRWTIDIEERPDAGVGTNCIPISAWMDANHDGAVTITASAGGAISATSEIALARSPVAP